jgi:hypothetical protein
MVSQVSTIYFQSYQLAYDMAKRAERAFQFERAEWDASFIKFGYWDSLKKGLLAGERLHYDLRRMETAYLERNQREYEITKHVSLALLDPVELVKLRETGRCIIHLPEELFDLDFHGHILRRMNRVSFTVPCVTGPYTSLNCTLTLLSNSVRIDPKPGIVYARTGDNDPRFRDQIGAVQSIATSSGQNDSGLFELNFHDERYLPFEGAGVVSDWLVDLPQDSNQFDFSTIADVVMHLRYTAREGGVALREAAKKHVADQPIAGYRFFSARHRFPTEWQKFLNPNSDGQTLTLPLTANEFPFLSDGKSVVLQGVTFLLRFREQKTDTEATAPSATYKDAVKWLKPTVTPAGKGDDSFQPDTTLGNLPRIRRSYTDQAPGPFTLAFAEGIAGQPGSIGDLPTPDLYIPVSGHNRLQANALDDVLIVVEYAVK